MRDLLIFDSCFGFLRPSFFCCVKALHCDQYSVVLLPETGTEGTRSHFTSPMRPVGLRRRNIVMPGTFGYFREPDGSTSHAFVAVGERDPIPIAAAMPRPPAAGRPDPTPDHPRDGRWEPPDPPEEDDWLDGLTDEAPRPSGQF